MLLMLAANVEAKHSDEHHRREKKRSHQIEHGK